MEAKSKSEGGVDLPLVPSMIADAIARAAALGKATAEAHHQAYYKLVYQEEERDLFLQCPGGGAAAELVAVDRPRSTVSSEHHSLTSFAAWVIEHNGDRDVVSKDEVPCQVFVDRSEVVAQWGANCWTSGRDRAVLPLAFTEAWKALERLRAGVGQKELHELLTADLHGCVDDALALHEINDEGELPVDWEFSGPVWTCFDEPITVPLRLSIWKPKDSGLMFKFAPAGLEARLIAYRGVLAESVAESLDGSVRAVYQGRCT